MLEFYRSSTVAMILRASVHDIAPAYEKLIQFLEFKAKNYGERITIGNKINLCVTLINEARAKRLADRLEKLEQAKEQLEMEQKELAKLYTEQREGLVAEIQLATTMIETINQAIDQSENSEPKKLGAAEIREMLGRISRQISFSDDDWPIFRPLVLLCKWCSDPDNRSNVSYLDLPPEHRSVILVLRHYLGVDIL